MTVLVVGARGRIAARVIDGVLAAGVTVRAASGQPDAVRVPAGVDLVGDIRQPAVLADALRGVDRVFLYAEPRGIDDLVAALRHAGVERVVLLSSAAVARLDDPSDGLPPVTEQADPIGWRHVVVERALAASGIPSTFVRPYAFATNTLHWAPGIRTDGVVRIARPGAESAPIHERDIADVAVRALLEPGHEGASYLLTGPESLSQRRQIENVGRAIGRPVRLVELSDDEARQQIARWGSPVIADRLVAMLAASDGRPAVVTDTVHGVLGRPARSFAEWVADHVAEFG